MILHAILFLVGFGLLVKGADWLVAGAQALARRAGVSDLVVGLTVVAFGTSLPELVVNVFATLSGHPAVAMGNILGSNIFNTLLILGIAALICPLTVQASTVWGEIPMCLVAALCLAVLGNDRLLRGADDVLGRGDGVLLLGCFCAFLGYVYWLVRRDHSAPNGTPETAPALGPGKAVLFVVIGVVALNFGAKWVVDGASLMAAALGVSESLIALTIVALGTSLPELVTSVAAARRGSADIAVGNVVGSNIFNIFFVLGASAALRPLPIGDGLNVDLAVVSLASALLFLFMFTGRRRNLLERWEGAVCLLLYAGYLGYIIQRG